MKLLPFFKHSLEILLALGYPLLIIYSCGLDIPVNNSSAEGKLSDYYASPANFLYPSEYPTIPIYPGEVVSIYPGDEKWNGHYIPDYPGYETIQIKDLDSNGTDIFAAVQGIPHQVARWNGSFWTSPSTSLLPVSLSGEVLSVAVQGGGVYYGGSFSEIGGKTADNIAYWDGAEWKNLGSGLTSSDGGTVNVHRLLVVGSSGVIAAGSFDRAGGVAVRNIAFWDGFVWHDLGGGFDGPVYALAGDLNNLYAGGAFPGAIAKWDGSAWSLLGGGIPKTDWGPGIVHVIAIKDGDVYVGGEFDYAPPGIDPMKNIGRWDGSKWNRLGAGVWSPVYALAVRSDGVYTGGRLNNVSVWNQAGWKQLGTGVYDAEYQSLFTPTVFDLLSFNDGIYAGGKFNRAGYNRSSGFASWHAQPTLEPYDYPYRPVAPGSTIYLIGRYFPRLTDLAVLVDGKVISEDFRTDMDGKMYVSLKTTRLLSGGAHTVTLRVINDPSVSASFQFVLLPGADAIDTPYWGAWVTIGSEIFLPAIQE